MRARFCILALAVCMAGVSFAFGQAPDCTGISAVHNSSPDLIGELDTVRIASGLERPTFITAAPGDTERLYVLEKRGAIRIIKNGILQAADFLNIDSIVTGGTSNEDERGLLGMAFHPDYENNGFFYLYYTGSGGALTLARYERDTADVANPVGQILLAIPHPISNHNGGMLAFSPIDGHLYMGTGDGGSGCDPGAFPGNAQNLNSLLGKMLRLDVDGDFPYATDGNPFDGAIPGLDEIWHRGLRNPWRFTFDRLNGDMYIGDVGQNAREELDCVTAGVSGLNMGWNAYEGFLCDTCNEWAPACPIDLGDEYHPPYREYSLAGAPCTVVGGDVYRGCRMPDLRGTYFYADHCSNLVSSLRTSAGCNTAPGPDTNRQSDLIPGSSQNILSIASFGDDNQGEMYILDHDGGEVFKVIPEMFIMELSGPGATPLTMTADGDFVWEDLQAASTVPTRFYKIYRADQFVPDSGPGPFNCIHSQAAASETWAGGDPDTPLAGQTFYYLMTALNSDVPAVESTAGAASDGTLRVVDTGSPCN